MVSFAAWFSGQDRTFVAVDLSWEERFPAPSRRSPSCSPRPLIRAHNAVHRERFQTCTCFTLSRRFPRNFPTAVIVGLPEEVLNSPMGGMLRPLLEQMTTQVRLLCVSRGVLACRVPRKPVFSFFPARLNPLPLSANENFRCRPLFLRRRYSTPPPPLPLWHRCQMNGADPYSALHHHQQQVGANATAPGAGAAAGAGVAQPPVPTPGAAAAAAAEQRAAAAAAASQQCSAASFPILDKHAKPLVGSDTAKAVRNDGMVILDFRLRSVVGWGSVHGGVWSLK